MLLLLNYKQNNDPPNIFSLGFILCPSTITNITVQVQLSFQVLNRTSKCHEHQQRVNKNPSLKILLSV